MKRVTVLLLALVIVCLAAGSVFAEGILTVEKQSLVRDSSDSGFFYAKVVNTGDEGIYLGKQHLKLLDEAGNVVIENPDILSVPYWVYLEPGDFIFSNDFIWDDALADVTDFELTVSEGTWGFKYERIPCEAELHFEAESYNNAVFVTVTNNTDGMLHDFFIAVAIYDEEDNLIFVDSTGFRDIGIHPGSTVTAMFDIDLGMTRYFTSNNIVPDHMEPVVYNRVD